MIMHRALKSRAANFFRSGGRFGGFYSLALLLAVIGATVAVVFVGSFLLSGASAASQGVLQQYTPVGGGTCWLQNYAAQSMGYVFTVPAAGARVTALGARDQDKTYTVRLILQP